MDSVQEKNPSAVQSLYAAFGRGDMATVMAGLTDDVEWILPGPANIIPFAGTHRGHDAVMKFFMVLNQTLEFEQFEPREFFAFGDKVVVLGHSRDRMKATGRTAETDWAAVLTLRDGKVSRYQVYEDTAVIASPLR